MSILVGRSPERDRTEPAPAHTGSRSTRLLGILTLAGVVGLCLCAFVFSPPDSRPGPEPGTRIGQFDVVRLLYIHVPSAVWTYVALGTCALASGVYLWRRSAWWDRLALACAEIGVLFCAITLLTGMIWGRPVWNTWWEWGDVRLVTTLVLFLTYVGYLALRSVPAAPEARARRAAILGVAGAVIIPIVNRSVEWWENRTLHQQSTLAELRIEDMTLFTLVLGIAVLGLVFLWLLVHRCRVAWLESEADRAGLEAALQERRTEIDPAELDRSPGHTAETELDRPRGDTADTELNGPRTDADIDDPRAVADIDGPRTDADLDRRQDQTAFAGPAGQADATRAQVAAAAAPEGKER